MGFPFVELSGRSRCELHANAVRFPLLGDEANPDALTERLEVLPERGRVQRRNLLIIAPAQKPLHALEHVPRHQ
jgi:hypothetical protein